MEPVEVTETTEKPTVPKTRGQNKKQAKKDAIAEQAKKLIEDEIKEEPIEPGLKLPSIAFQPVPPESLPEASVDPNSLIRDILLLTVLSTASGFVIGYLMK